VRERIIKWLDAHEIQGKQGKIDISENVSICLEFRKQRQISTSFTATANLEVVKSFCTVRVYFLSIFIYLLLLLFHLQNIEIQGAFDLSLSLSLSLSLYIYIYFQSFAT
jgi:hypothetical protein